MKIKNYLPAILFVCIVCFSCSEDSLDTSPDKIENEVVTDQPKASPSHPDVIAKRDNYELVVKDADNWEIMLNLERVRGSYSLCSYEGHLYYKISSYLIKGKASAIYDPRTKIMTVCANDSAWNRGMIHYSILIESATLNPTGNFCYLDKPRSMNAISSEIVKGVVGYNTKSGKGAPQTPPKPKSEPLTPEQLKAIESYIPSKYIESDWEDIIFNKK